MSAARFAKLLLLPVSLCLLLAGNDVRASSAIEVWFGSAPFCKATPDHCHVYDLEFVRFDSSGSGSKCTRGDKALCRTKQLTKGPLETPKNDLVVVAYNVMEVPFSVAHNGQTERTCHIPRALLNAVPDTDVIVLNELFMGGCLQSKQADRALSLSDIFDTYGFLHSTNILGESSRGFYNKNGGTVIVSRWPILDSKELVYTQYAGIDTFSDKGAVYAKVLKQGIVYHIIGTNLQSNSDDYEKVRVDQAHELSRFITDLEVPRTDPVIIAGDFNCDRLNNNGHVEGVLKAMQAGMPSVIGEVTATHDYATNAMVESGHMVKEWLDYVVFSTQHKQPGRANLEALRLKADTKIRYCKSAILQPYYVSPDSMMCGKAKRTTDLSDHYPVIGRFTFN